MVKILMTFLWSILFILPISCSQRNQNTVDQKVTAQVFQTTGSIEVLDSALFDVIKPDAKLEIIAEGFGWAEGPLWIPEGQKLIFSDVPNNKVYQWSETSGLQLYLTPSGYTGKKERGEEVGSNGLLLDLEGRLVLCQHGDRRMARMSAPLDKPKPQYVTLADNYKGKKFNSPNDAVYSASGDLYFTDPPYGLEKKMADPAKEIPYQGVYWLTKDGEVQLLTKGLSRPNGIALSPDGRLLYVANSDQENPVWMAYPVQEDGSISSGSVFFDATALAMEEEGLPDGLKINSQGTLFASGPGGVLIISRSGKHLGTIKTGALTSNCAFNEDESFLYITANNYLMRVSIK